jgi:hypothetical protein
MAAQYDAVIIRAGRNGLVAGTYLARAGKRLVRSSPLAHCLTGSGHCSADVPPVVCHDSRCIH